MIFNRKVKIFKNGVIEVSKYDKMLMKRNDGQVSSQEELAEIEGLEMDNELTLLLQSHNHKGGRTLEQSSNHDLHKAQNLYRARRRIRDLINSNADELTKFVTLTFADNIQDFDFANNQFKKFILRLQYRFRPQKIKYVTVLEQQKRGAIHYHMLVNLPYIQKEELYQIWRNGFVHIKEIDHVDNVGAYVCKYLTKSTTQWLGHRKCYLASKNLEKPLEIRDIDDEEKKFICDQDGVIIADLSNEYLVHSSTKENVFCGKVKYKQYNTNRKDVAM